jgi:integrase
MARPRRDGAPPAPTRRAKLTSVLVRNMTPEPKQVLTWDTQTAGLVLAVQPSGSRSFKFIYSCRGRLRWFHLGADALPLSDARKKVRALRVLVDGGTDPAADKAAQRSSGSFADLAVRYVEDYAKRRNKSWQQANALVNRYALKRLGMVSASTIRRDDIEGVLAKIDKPILRNAVLSSLSAIFSWAQRKQIGGIVIHPCKGVDRNEAQSRERILSDSELPLFWAEFDTAGVDGMALKLILLTGQRPGEVCAMQYQHIVDGKWWEMPGQPTPTWPGTKNGESHRVYIPKAAQKLIGEKREGFVFEVKGQALNVNRLSNVMRDICSKLGIERANKVTPHDLRRSHGTKIAALGFGRDAMNRIQNHKEGGIASVYDRHGYADENKRIMESVANHIMRLIEDKHDAKVIPLAARA